MVCCNMSSRNPLTAINVEEEDDSATPVNAIDQALPSIVIIPSDQVLKRNHALETKNIDGVEYIIRDYQRYLLNQDDKKLIRYFQDKFIDLDFPLNDLEQSLKNLVTLEASNEADHLATDAKTQLLASVSPDFILELDYTYKFPQNLNNHNKELGYTLSLIDPTTEKVLATASSEGSGATFDDAITMLNDKDFNKLTDNLKKEFAKTIRKGREVNVRITIDSDCDIVLSDACNSGDTYTDFIVDFMDTKAKKGTYALKRNSDMELYFTNVRITNVEKNGTQTNAYKWARQLCKALRREAGVQAVNKSQKLNDIHIVITGTI